MTEDVRYMCKECGLDLTNEFKKFRGRIEVICPECGCKNGNVFLTLTERLGLSTSLKITQQNEDGSLAYEQTVREDVSHGGDSVRIIKVVDRTDPERTTFTHKIVGKDEHNILEKTIHEHNNEHPAKHRLKK